MKKIFFILGIFLSWTIVSNSQVISKFEFSITWGVMSRNSYNSKTKEFQKDLVLDVYRGKLKLTRKQMKSILQKINELPPPQARQLDVPAQDTGQFGPEPGQGVPLGLADQQFGVAHLAQTADMVAMQVRQHDCANVACTVADAFQQDAQGLVRSHVEPGHSVQRPHEGPRREIVWVGDRCAILARVKQHQPVAVLDDIDVDRARRGPLPGGEHPQECGLPGAGHVLRVDLHAAGADNAHPADRVTAGHGGRRSPGPRGSTRRSRGPPP